MRVTRRAGIAIAASVGLHLVAVGAIVASSLWDAWPRAPVDIEITGMRLEDLKDLPLGAPAGGDKQPDAVVAPAPRAPAARVHPKRDDGPQAEAARERPPGPKTAGANPDGGAGPPRPTSVRSYAPEGSRVSALLRIDRLRGTPYASLVDALLMNLPDRRDLLEGTGIDLYRDIDAVLIATPNPLDATVTFLAVRHRLADAALRAALDRGARATGRRLIWRTERGRPFAERRATVRSATGAGGNGPTAAGEPAAGSRDHRLILLPAPRLVVVAPPAYRSLILRGRAPAPGAGGARDGADGGVAGDGGAGASGARPDVDAGAGVVAAAANEGNDWAALIGRIDAEDSIMPPDAVAMVSAADLFSARTLRGALDAVPGTRGNVDDDGARPTGGATVMGLPVPRLLTATMGVAPQPFADLDAEFADQADAVRWEQEWPRLRGKFLTNPLVVLSGFAGIIAHTTLGRAGATVHVRVDATELEATRLLQIIASQLPALR